jgi:hypothetical protein
MLKKKTKTKLKKIKKAVCKSIKKGIENMGTPIAKSKGII